MANHKFTLLGYKLLFHKTYTIYLFLIEIKNALLSTESKAISIYNWSTKTKFLFLIGWVGWSAGVVVSLSLWIRHVVASALTSSQWHLWTRTTQTSAIFKTQT